MRQVIHQMRQHTLARSDITELDITYLVHRRLVRYHDRTSSSNEMTLWTVVSRLQD
jgi:hypothetical protein